MFSACITEHRRLAGAPGFEPGLTDPKSAVLPLDEGPEVLQARVTGTSSLAATELEGRCTNSVLVPIASQDLEPPLGLGQGTPHEVLT